MALSLDWEPNKGTSFYDAFKAAKTEIGDGLITIYINIEGTRVPVNHLTSFEDAYHNYELQLKTSLC